MGVERGRSLWKVIVVKMKKVTHPTASWFLFCSLRMVVTVDQTPKLSFPCLSEARNDPQQPQQDRDLEGVGA